MPVTSFMKRNHQYSFLRLQNTEINTLARFQSSLDYLGFYYFIHQCNRIQFEGKKLSNTENGTSRWLTEVRTQQAKYMGKYNFKMSQSGSYKYTKQERVVSSRENIQSSRQMTSSAWDSGREANLQQEMVYRSIGSGSAADIGFDQLVQKREVLTDLLREFGSRDGRVSFDGSRKEDYNKRLLLLEQQIEGLMRQSFVYERGEDRGTRTMDYGALINEKQNQVAQLEKKIASLEGKHRMEEYRMRELQAEIEKLHGIILNKNKAIEQFQNSSKRVYQDSSTSSKATNEIKNLINKLQGLEQRGCTLQQLDAAVEGWILALPEESGLKEKLKIAQLRYASEDKYRTSIMRKLGQISTLYRKQIDDIRTSSRTNIDYDDRILNPLGVGSKVGSKVGANNSKDGIWGLLSTGADIRSSGNQQISYNIVADMWDSYSRDWSNVRTVEVPVQDARTKALIHKLAKQMNRLVTKYPKLNKEISPELSEFFTQEIIDMIEVDELDRLVSIVKYEPQVVKVDNVYAYSSEKSRKVQFHLRVLIKALLEEMQKIKRKTGLQFEIDSGVIGMIRQEVMDVVDVDDILRVYRVVPKIVEVEKVVEKIVEKIVEVPRMVAVETSQAVPIQSKRVEIVENVRNVPVEVQLPYPIREQKIVKVPEYVEKIVEISKIEPQHIESVRQIPKLRTVETVVPRERQVERIIQVEGPEKIVEIPRVQIKEICMQKIVEVLKTEEIIKEVERIIEKPVEVVREVPKMVVVEKIVEKIIPVKEYINNDVPKPYIVDRPYPVEVIVEKIIPVEKIVERIVEVPQIVEKVVVVEERVEIPKIVELIREVPIVQREIQVIERIIEKPTEQIIEVEKVFDRIVEVPIVHENVRVETEYVKEPVVERVEKLIHQEVPVEVPVVLYEDKIVEVETVRHTIAVQQEPVTLYQDRIVPLQTVREQVIPTPTVVEKVIEKLVEVPRVVEVERIVEKIVPVPRVVQKIVEVEKIVEKIVKEFVIQPQIVEVERRVEVPVFQERVIEVEVPRNIYSRVQVPREVVREVMVRDQEVIEKATVQMIEQPPRVVIERKEVDVPMMVEKIVSVRSYDNKYMELKEQIIVPVEIQVPKQIIQEKLVPVEHVRPVVQEVDRVVEKIVQVTVDRDPEVVAVDRIVERLEVQYQKDFIQVPVPQPVDRIVEVQRMVQKIIPPVTIETQRIKEVPYMVQKIVDRLVQIPRIYEVEKLTEVPIDRPYVYHIDKLVPQIITLNQSIEKIVDRVVEVPTLLEKINRIDKISERIVPVRETNTHVETVDRTIEKEVLVEKLKEVHNVVNHVSEVMQVVERMIERPVDPVIIYDQKIMEVPVVIQKIAEKIVVMPQIVEVLKYVHEITDQESLGVAVSGEVGVEEAEYQRLGRNLNGELTKLRSMLSSSTMRQSQSTQVRNQLTVIEDFLTEFNKFILYPRIREIVSEKVIQNTVQKDRIVRVPVSSAEDDKRGLASAVLIDKLVMELRRLRKTNPGLQMELDQDIQDIFGSQLNPVSGEHGNNYNKLLDEYSRAIFSRFSSAGSWTPDHQEMLREFINDRFQLAYLSKKNENDAKQYRARYQSAINNSRKYKDHIDDIQKRFSPFHEVLPVILEEGLVQGRLTSNTKRQYDDLVNELTQAVFGYAMSAQTRPLERIQYDRVSKVIREKEEEIIRLKERIAELMRSRTQIREVITRDADHSACNQKIRYLEEEIRRMRHIEQEHQGCQSRLRALVLMEKQHGGCRIRIDELLAQIQRLKREIADMTRTPSKTAVKVVSESQGEHYGTHYEQYTNLNDNEIEQSSDDQYASRNNIKGYGSAGGNTTAMGYNSGYQQYMASSRGSSGDIGVDSKGYTYKSAVNRVEYSGGDQSSHRTIEYSRAGSNMEDSFRGGVTGTQSGIQGSEGGGSRMYEQSNREIIRRTYREEEFGSGGGTGTSSSKRFQRDAR